ncbi:MAG: sulfite exporter TauE/SafE family protein [Methylococcales bacterium]|nr:sulfite exporter TauE/SafE family protein [Methylococcales bacterium]
MAVELNFATSYLVAFGLGLFSSLHCLGMCGSIIGTLTLSLKPEVRSHKARLIPFVVSYNLGRIISYSLAGMLAGLFEVFLSLPFGEGHGHRILQLLSAAIMTGAGLYISGWFPKFAYIEKTGRYFWRMLEPYGRRLVPVTTRFQAFLFGAVWGWLPCGLVYTGLVLAAATGSFIHSGLTMLAFGLGTLPAVAGAGIIASLVTRLMAMPNFRRAIGVFMILLAILAALPWLNPLRMQHF